MSKENSARGWRQEAGTGFEMSWEDSKLIWEFLNVSSVTLYKAEHQILIPGFYEVAEVQN